MAETLEEFLVSVKYGVDAASQGHFLESMQKVAAKVHVAAGAVVGLATAIFGLGKVLSTAGDQFYWMSQRMGAGVSDIQAAAFAMSQLGISSDAAKASMVRFGDWTRANGSAATAYLQSIGVTASNTEEQLAQLGDRLRAMGGTLANAHGNAAQRDRFAQARMWAQSVGVDESTMLAITSPDYRQQKQRAGLIQQVVWGAGTEDQVKQKQDQWAAQAMLVARQFREFGLFFDTVRQKFAKGLFDVLLPKLEALNKLLLDNMPTINALIDAGIKGIGIFLDVLVSLVTLFQELPGVIQVALVALTQLPGLIALAGNPIFWLITAIVALLGFIDDYKHWQNDPKTALFDYSAIDGLMKAIGDAVKPFEPLITMTKDWWTSLGGIEGIWKAINEQIKDLKTNFDILEKTWIGQLLTSKIEAPDMTFGGLFPRGWLLKLLNDMLSKQPAAPGQQGSIDAPSGNQYAGPGALPGPAMAGGSDAGNFLANYVMGGGAANGNYPAGSLAGIGGGGPDSSLRGDAGSSPGGVGREAGIRILTAYFRAQGWSPAQTAGIVANLLAESGTLNPAEVGDGGAAYGIAQWHPDRQAMFERVMRRPIRGSSLLEQAQFIQWELTHSEAAAGQALAGQTTARGAGGAVSRLYERPGATPAARSMEEQRRGGAAETLMPQMTNVAPMGGGGGGGGGGGMALSNQVTINIAAGPTAEATAHRVGRELDRVFATQVRVAQGRLA